MADFTTITDYNVDDTFTGIDLDISWAYIQVKSLIDLGQTNIHGINVEDQTSLIAAVQAQYDLNKQYEIAKNAINKINLSKKYQNSVVTKLTKIDKSYAADAGISVIPLRPQWQPLGFH